MVLVMSAAGCRRQTAVPCVNVAQSAPAPVASPAASPGSIDQGDFKVVFAPRHRKPGTENGRVGTNPQYWQDLVDDLNREISMPFDMTTNFLYCDEDDAFYDPDTRTISMCYQLIDHYYEMFGPTIKDPAKLDEAVRGATVSTFIHELGHALIDAWDLPITGREEDAADQLSNLVLLHTSERGEQMTLTAAIQFRLYAKESKGKKRKFYNEHSLDEQRFYDTICMIYGNKPEKYKYLVDDGTLPEERAEDCPDDFAKIAYSWHKLIAPYLKHPSATLKM
jgi:hypothetical protein